MPSRQRVAGKSVHPHDVTAGINPCCSGEDSAGEINRSELAILTSQKAVVVTSAHVSSDNLAGRIDAEGSGEGSAREVNRGEGLFSMLIIILNIDPHDLPSTWWESKSKIGNVQVAIGSKRHCGRKRQPGCNHLDLSVVIDPEHFTLTGRRKSWGITHLQDVETVIIIKCDSQYSCNSGQNCIDLVSFAG